MTRPSPTRRSFLGATLAAGAALAHGIRPDSAAAAPVVSGKPVAGKIGNFKISLTEVSLARALMRKEFDHLDFPRIAKSVHGIDAVEFVSRYFKDKARDPAYLKELKTRASDHGVTCVLIMVEGEGDVSHKDRAERMTAVENHKKWVDAAATLGCHSIRVNTGYNFSATDVAAVAEACSALAEYGEQQKINVICENHGGPSSIPDALLALVKAVNRPRFGTLPDFGNFPKDRHDKYMIDVYDAIARLMPYAKGVSAKSLSFRSGWETSLDYPRILKIVTDSGYDGYVGIEYVGKRLTEAQGIKTTRELLQRCRGSMYTPRS